MSLNLRSNDIVELKEWIRAKGCAVIERRDPIVVDVRGCDGTSRFAEEWSELRGINADEFRGFLDENGTPCDCAVLMDIDLSSPRFQLAFRQLSPPKEASSVRSMSQSTWLATFLR